MFSPKAIPVSTHIEDMFQLKIPMNTFQVCHAKK